MLMLIRMSVMIMMIIILYISAGAGYLVSFLLQLNPLDAAVYLLCSIYCCVFAVHGIAVYLLCSCFLHLKTFANPLNPASYFAERDAAKEEQPGIH